MSTFFSSLIKKMINQALKKLIERRHSRKENFKLKMNNESLQQINRSEITSKHDLSRLSCLEIHFKAVHHWVQAVKVLSATEMLKPISITVSASIMVLTYVFIIFFFYKYICFLSIGQGSPLLEFLFPIAVILIIL